MDEHQPARSSRRSFRLENFFSRTEIPTAVKTGITAALALFTGVSFTKLMDRPDTLISGLWCTLTAIVVLQAHLGGTYRASWIRFLGVIAGSFFGGLFTSLFGSTPISLGVSITATVICCSLLNIKDSIRIACLSVSVVMVLWGLRPEISPWTFSLYRVLDSTLGILIAMFVAHILWPEKATQKLRLSIAQTIFKLSELYRFVTDLNPESHHFEMISEKLNHEVFGLVEQNREYFEDSKLELLTRTSNPEDWSFLIIRLESMVEMLTALNTINKHNLNLILDDSLAERLAEVVDKTDLALIDLYKALETGLPATSFPALASASQRLDEDLLRFRSTRTTRKFNLQDVESFFVFFYSIKSFNGNLSKMEQKINEIVSEKATGA